MPVRIAEAMGLWIIAAAPMQSLTSTEAAYRRQALAGWSSIIHRPVGEMSRAVATLLFQFAWFEAPPVAGRQVL